MWNFCVFTVFDFCPTYRETPEPPGDGNSNFCLFCLFCGLKLLRDSLKAPALTGYVGDAQDLDELIANCQSLQRAQSTLAGSSAVQCGTNVARMEANRAIQIRAQRMQGPRGLVSVLEGGMTANECW